MKYKQQFRYQPLVVVKIILCTVTFIYHINKILLIRSYWKMQS